MEFTSSNWPQSLFYKNQKKTFKHLLEFILSHATLIQTIIVRIITNAHVQAVSLTPNHASHHPPPHCVHSHMHWSKLVCHVTCIIVVYFLSGCYGLSSSPSATSCKVIIIRYMLAQLLISANFNHFNFYGLSASMGQNNHLISENPPMKLGSTL